MLRVGNKQLSIGCVAYQKIPEDQLPDPSLLAKFRTQRLSEYNLDDIITEIVRQCVEKGIIEGRGISIDATHIRANTNRLIPERIMKHSAKRIFS